MNIAFFDTKTYDIDSFKKFISDDINIKFYETKLNIDTVNLVKGFEAICIFVNDEVNKEVIDKLYEYNVKVIALRCSGYNNVDLKYAFKKIHVFHVPSYSPYAISEHAIAMLLTLVRHIHKAYLRIKDFNFSLNNLTGFTLHGKTMGVIGTGKIGKAFINIVKGMGMKVIAYDKYPDYNSNINYVSLEKLLEESNIISLHCPLTKETYHMINKDALEKCQKGVIIINTSRGALIDTESLLEGIKERKIGGACLDVYEEESDIFFTDNSEHIMDDEILARLISMPNVLITSHQAFLTTEALESIAQTTINNLISFFKFQKCENELCYDCGKREECQRKRENKCF